MENNQFASLYESIASSVVDGGLPADYTLPRPDNDDNGILWADGALDGVTIYHMNIPPMSEEEQSLMENAVRAAAVRDYDQAYELFVSLGKNVSAIRAIDDLQSFVLNHQEELDPQSLYEYSVYAVMASMDKECVKYGLSLMELFDLDANEDLKKAIRTIGLSDEFAIYAVFLMMRWTNGNNEIWQLAQKVHGWGRIHAIERLDPDTEEIRHWLLTEGVHNNVMLAYSALTCWEKAGVQMALQNPLTREEYEGIRDIIDGLLDEGPVPGISEIDNAEDMVLAFLRQSKTLATDAEDHRIIRNIRFHYEDDDHAREDIVSECERLLQNTKYSKTAE